MPTLPIICGFAPGYYPAVYTPITGDLDDNAIEACAQFIVRDSYTLANLYIYCNFNTRGVQTTALTRVNGGNGNQTVNIPAATTGVFQDLINTDALVDGDLVNHLVTPSGDTIKFSLWAHTLNCVNNSMILGSTYLPGCNFNGLQTYNQPIAGLLYPNIVFPEADAGYTFRTSAILSNLRCHVRVNAHTGASTIRIRVNAGNVNQILNIPAGITGFFEDAVNTDAINIGDEVNYQQVCGAGPDWVSALSFIQIKSTSVVRQYIVSEGGFISQSEWPAGTWFCTLEGRVTKNSNETHTQTLAQVAFTGRNMFVRVTHNTLTTASVVTIRINSGNGNMTITVPSTLTGTFEDLVNTDNFIATDLLNYQVANSGGSNWLRFSYIGIEGLPAQAPTGIADKSANMGNKMVGVGLI